MRRPVAGGAGGGEEACSGGAAVMTSEEALQQAQAEGLVLLVTGSKTGYYGVYLSKSGQPKPYQARVRHGGKQVSLGYFARGWYGFFRKSTSS